MIQITNLNLALALKFIQWPGHQSADLLTSQWEEGRAKRGREAMIRRFLIHGIET